MMKKKNLLVFALALTTLVGCGGNGSSEPSTSGGNGESQTSREPGESIEFDNVQLTFGNPITGADGDTMRELVKKFNKEYQGQIQITESFMAETEYYESLQITIPMKRSYNIALVHSYRVQAFANKNLLIPLQPIIDRSEMDLERENFIPAVYDAMYLNDQLYGIPLDLHSIVLYYNQDLLDEYGLDVPTNRAELLEAAKKMPNSGNKWGLPISTAWPSEYIYTTALYQNGGVEIDANSNPMYNSPAGLTALDMVASIVHEHKISPTNVGVDADMMIFNQGNAMFHINGNWMLGEVLENAEASEMNFGVTSVGSMFTDNPNTEYADKVHARSHVFVLPDGRMDEIEEEAALVFINWMTENATIWAEAGGHILANNAARETPEYAELVYQKQYGDLDDFQLNPPSPYWYEAYSPVFSRVTTALSEADYDATELLAEAEDEGRQLVAEAKSLV